MIVNAGVCPDPKKVEALDHITHPTNKEELNSFLCMMQANADFIPNFAQQAAILRAMTHKKAVVKWTKVHQQSFVSLVEAFKKDALLRYFDPELPTFLFVDAYKTGVGDMLAQGHTIKNARPIAVASRTTNAAEKKTTLR